MTDGVRLRRHSEPADTVVGSMAMHRGKLTEQAACMQVLHQRYAQAGERSVDDVRRRVAQALGQAEPRGERTRWGQRFLWAMRWGLVPAGRILAGAGRSAMLINCFVLPVNKDPIGLNATLAQALGTLKLGGGVGYDFSPLAPAGPMDAIQKFDEACRALETPRGRRGAQMAVLRCDHPDILAFVHAKDHGGLSSFNLSVAVPDGLMRAVDADAAFDLVHASPPGNLGHAVRRADGMWVHSVLPARALWHEVLRSAHGQGEPGILFIDRINEDNNLSHCEHIHATNPCAEQPLPPYGACCLASIDLTRLVVDPFGPRAHLRLDRLAELVHVGVRMLDNVLDLTAWPWPQQGEEARLKRRIGLGVTGLGDALVMLGLPYGAETARQQVMTWMAAIRDHAYQASCNLARQRGAFPCFKAEALLSAPHCASRLPPAILDAIRRHGLRNSHLLAVAPAGSISLAMCDNVSSGIEPVFAWQTQRSEASDAPGEASQRTAEDHAWRLHRHLLGIDAPMGPAFVTARQIAPADHVAMVAAVAPFVDGSISKTVNVRDDMPLPELDGILMAAWRAGLKGLAIYRSNAVLPAPLKDASPCCPV